MSEHASDPVSDNAPTADDVVFLIRHQSSPGYDHIPDDVLEAFIHYEWNSGRWAAICHQTDSGQNGGLLAWVSWYNLDPPSLEQVREFGIPGCFFQKLTLNDGHCCYVGNMIVRERAPKGVFRVLWNLVCRKNPQSQNISGHICNRPCEDGNPPLLRWCTRPNKAWQPDQVTEA